MDRRQEGSCPSTSGPCGRYTRPAEHGMPTPSNPPAGAEEAREAQAEAPAPEVLNRIVDAAERKQLYTDMAKLPELFKLD